MAQPRRFAYFRDRQRRNGSTPTSPALSNPGSAASLSSPSFPNIFISNSQTSPPSQSPVSPLPPTLPPIPRVASQTESVDTKGQDLVMDGDPSRVPAPTPPTQPQRSTIRPIQPSFSGASSETSFVLPPIPRVSSTRATGSQDGPHGFEVLSGDKDSIARKPTGFRKSNQQELHRPYGRTEGVSAGDFDRTTIAPSSNDHHVFKRPITPTASHNDGYLLPSARQDGSTSPSSSYSSVTRTGSSTNLASDSLTSTPNRSPNTSAKEARQAKSRKHLLNPMSLLRRRSAQPPEEAVEATMAANRTNLDIPVMSLPQDYDPRIKGKGVHDFSVPRDKRHTSSNESTRPVIPSQSSSRRPSTPGHSGEDDRDAPTTAIRKGPERERPPVFVESFDESEDTEADESAVRREGLANPGFLARMSRQLDFHSSEDKVPRKPGPPDKTIKQEDSTSEAVKQDERISFGASSGASTMRSSISHETRATSPPISPQKGQTRASLEPAIQPGRLSSQFSRSTSHASRFSFQLNNDRSAAQEKALEDKHKEKVRNQAAKAQRDSRFDDFEDDDLAEYDDMMDDDGLEERIPGVNADDDDGFNDFPPIRGTELSSASQGKNMYDPAHRNTQPVGSQGHDATQALVSGLGLVQLQDQQLRHYSVQSRTLKRQATDYSKISDDMYFDDGVIESPGTQRSNPMDESTLDSPTNKAEDEQANALKAILTKSSSVYTDQTTTPSVATTTRHASQSAVPESEQAEGGDRKLQDYHQALASAANRAAEAGKFRYQDSISDHGDEQEPSGQEDMDVTPRKPAKKFQLPQSYEQDEFEMGDNIGFEEISDDLDDDPMVAAANAEALAADDSGFYGQEFGFYVSSHGKGDESLYGGFFGSANAGMQNALKEPNLTPITERSEFSTRNSFISVGGYGPPGSATYLSSSVPRDSMASVDLRTLAAQMTEQDEDDMTLSQLMKLRKETFGGSRPNSFGGASNSGQHSPSKSASSLPAIRGGGAWAQNTPQDVSSSHDDIYQLGRMGSWPSEEANFLSPQRSASSEAPMNSASHNQPSFAIPEFPHTAQDVVLKSNAPVSPPPPPVRSPPAPPQSALTGVPVAAPMSPPPQLNPNPMPMPSSSVLQKFSTRPPANSYSNFHSHTHHRNSSSGDKRESFPSADSVTYVRDESDGGEEPRWFLERRRTMESGEVVVVGRQLVEGGRI